MTRSKYFLAALLQKFGVIRKTKRLTEAAYEMHLMQDGEEILGAYCWQNIEHIEELSLEYWNLRGLDSRKKELLEKIRKAEAVMAEAQGRKAAVLAQSPDPDNPAIKKRNQLSDQIKSLQETHEEKMNSALAIKKKHQALKMKLKVLQEESAEPDEIQTCLTNLSELRNTFTKEKEGLEQIKKRLEDSQTQLRLVEEEIGESFRGTEGETIQAYAMISKANREITNYQAELAAIEEEQNVLFREVGHFLNLNAKRSDCQKACKGSRIILTQVRLLFLSVNLNRRLVERLSH